jgi:protease II
MKRLLFLFFLIPFAAFSQITDTIEVSFTKSSYILLSKAPKFDFGSEDVIIRQSDNKLIVQAAKEGFEETNLFVQVDESIMLFVIRFNKNPKKFIYNYTGAGTTSNVDQGNSGVITTDNSIANAKKQDADDKLALEAKLKPLCEKVLNNGVDYLNEGEINFGNLVWCSAIYTNEEFVFFKIRVDNSSNIAYEAAYSTYTIRDRKDLLKKKAIQDYETQPVFILNPFQTIGPKDKLVMVVAFKRFTIDKDKVITAEVWEKNGDRRMKIDISGRVILKSKLLSELN